MFIHHGIKGIQSEDICIDLYQRLPLKEQSEPKPCQENASHSIPLFMHLYVFILLLYLMDPSTYNLLSQDHKEKFSILCDFFFFVHREPV